MTPVKFVVGCRVGFRYYMPGDRAGVSDSVVDDLIQKGFATRLGQVDPDPEKPRRKRGVGLAKLTKLIQKGRSA